MPVARVQLPDGRIARLEVPEGTTPEQIESFVSTQFKAQAPQEKHDPTEGMSGGERFAAGMGQAMNSTRLGLKQAGATVADFTQGIDTRSGALRTPRRDAVRGEIEETRRLDAPLLDTAGGMAGSVAGNVAIMAPTMFVPGANTMAGAAGIGAVSGLLQPSASTAETLQNTAMGGALGPAALGAGRALVAGAQGAKALVEPFTSAGREKIAARTLQAFAGGPERAAEAAARINAPRSVLPGVQPTTAEVSGNAGLAQLERALRNNPDLVTTLTERLQGNRGAMLNALQGIAGDDAAMAAAKAARESAAKPLYASAEAARVPGDETLQALLGRPSMKHAIARAEQLAREAGENIKLGQDVPASVQSTGVLDANGQPITVDVPAQFAEYTGRGLHYLKMAMDDLLEDPAAHGIGGNEARAIAQTRGQFLDWFEKSVPDYQAARQTYAAQSRPINQMEIGRELVNKFQPALADFGADSSTTAATYARALRDGDVTAQRATGMPNATLGRVMAPEQMNTLREVAEQLARRANADNLGRSPGSPTAQNLVSQNLLRQLLGPMGLPESVGENALLQTLLRPAQWAGKVAEPRVLNRLAEIVLTPEEAANALRLAQQQGIPLRALRAVEPGLAPSALGVAYGVQQ